MRFVQASILDVPVFLARTGYTGETGFELFFEPCHATRLWCRLLDEGAELGITPFGVLAAQVLRTEKGFALHGTDMSRDNNPYEMGLGWTVCLEKKEFLGKDALARIRAVGPTQRFRRFYIEGGRTVPRGTAVLSSDRRIGTVSSCCRSPTLARTVGMGLLDSSISSASECFVEGGGGRSALTFTDESFYDPEGLRVRARLNGN
jgi:aminomethyltransferase